jgi:protein phosphatase
MERSPPPSTFKAALQAFVSNFSQDIPRYANRALPTIITSFSVEFAIHVFQYVGDLFRSEPILLEINPPCVIIGDLHGQILDLLRIRQRYGDPAPRTYLFLGDLVDRGEFSIETVLVVFLMKAIWPHNVYIIRGNHEFASLCSAHGFLTQVLSSYSFPVFQAAIEAFVYIPLAAKIGRIVCVHGGLGPDVTTLSVIKELQRPIEQFEDPVVDALMWSDPSEELLGFEPSDTIGTGYAFGESALSQFLRASNLDMLIRAHECVADGFRWQFGRRLLTVFSASNYTGVVGNCGAVAEISGTGEIKTQQFPPLPLILRTTVMMKAAVLFGSSSPDVGKQTAVPCAMRESSSLPKLRANDSPRHKRRVTT